MKHSIHTDTWSAVSIGDLPSDSNNHNQLWRRWILMIVGTGLGLALGILLSLGLLYWWAIGLV